MKQNWKTFDMTSVLHKQWILSPLYYLKLFILQKKCDVSTFVQFHRTKSANGITESIWRDDVFSTKRTLVHLRMTQSHLRGVSEPKIRSVIEFGY